MEIDSRLRLRREGSVVQITLAREPHNYLDTSFVTDLAKLLLELDTEVSCRAIVLSSDLRSFSAGADFGNPEDSSEKDLERFYSWAMKIYQNKKPIIAAIEGPSVGAGLGLALAADFRIVGGRAWFSASFNKLGFHPGFGLSASLPRLIGSQKAAHMFYTGRRVGAEEAVQIGIADELAPDGEVLKRAMKWAHDIASSAPLAVESTRETLRAGLLEEMTRINTRELALQREQFKTDDFLEGVKAMAERREPVFRRR